VTSLFELDFRWDFCWA